MSSVQVEISAISALKSRLLDGFLSTHPGLLSRFPVETYVSHLDQCPKFYSYRHMPDRVLEYCRAIEAQAGQAALLQYHKLLLLTLMNSFEQRVASKSLPDCVLSLIQPAFKKIVDELETNPDDYYLHSNDFFSKDLGICRLKLLPCGAKLVEDRSGVPRRLLMQSGLAQLLRGLYYFAFVTRGMRPFYQMHADVRYRREFHPAGIEKCNLRIAKLLDLNPEIKGVFGTSWWYDPKLEQITPSLSFLRTLPEENGAAKFCIGTIAEDIDDATKYSKKRRALYEAGSYVPKWYTMVWARKDMLRWAASKRTEAAF